MLNYLIEDVAALKRTLNSINQELEASFCKAAKMLVDTLKKGNKVLVCGNGGSAADAEHFAGEIVGRFGYDRPSLPCVSLCTPSATFTAISNDYGYQNVFARQVSGLGKTGDLLIGISTSGNSQNIVSAFKTAKPMGITTIALIGNKNCELDKVSDLVVRAPSPHTPRIQEIHGLLIHSLCKALEQALFPNANVSSLPAQKIIAQNDIIDFCNFIKPFKTVFTNGCFDILHPGHVYLLNECKKYGEILILGLNSDDSVKRLKGDSRPYHSFSQRALVLSALESVDYIIEFVEDTPKNLIETLTPNVLVKGGDYRVDTVVGADWVLKHGGKVEIVNLLQGHSTSKILAKYDKL